MAIKNVLLYNAALNGYVAGSFAGGYPVDNVQADYADIVAQGVTYAAALDALIAEDLVGSPQPATTVGISVDSAGVGVAISGAGSAALVEAQSAKPQLMFALSFGAAFGRWSTTVTAADFAVLVAAIKAIYFEAALSNSYAT
jgi:hypothetical protein